MDSMEEKMINTLVVCGFLDVGKTTYIQDNIFRDFFHKRGKTLILAFEDGETEYDTDKLASFRTDVALYEGGEEIPAFCLRQIELHQPDRIYIEANTMMEGLLSQLPSILRVVDVTTLIDGRTLSLYFNNLRQQLQDMVKASNMVTFRGPESKASLAPFSTAFYLMNHRCAYLWESPMGYAEKAFGLYLPFDADAACITITDENYPVWFLDAQENPDRYDGKTLELHVQAQLRSDLPENTFLAGRLVMTCCMADLQFLGFTCTNNAGLPLTDRCWLHLRAVGRVSENRYHAKVLTLDPLLLEPGSAGSEIAIGPIG